MGKPLNGRGALPHEFPVAPLRRVGTVLRTHAAVTDYLMARQPISLRYWAPLKRIFSTVS